MTHSDLDNFALRGTKCEGSYQAICAHLDGICGPEGWRMSYRWVCGDKFVCKVELLSPSAGEQYPWVGREAVDTNEHNAFREAVERWGVAVAAAPAPPNPDDLKRQHYLEKISLATTMDDLNAVGSELAGIEINNTHRNTLRSAWGAKAQEISA